MTDDIDDIKQMRSDLVALRDKHGFDSPIGRHASNILEIEENHRKATDPEHKARLLASMAKQTAALVALCKADG